MASFLRFKKHSGLLLICLMACSHPPSDHFGPLGEEVALDLVQIRERGYLNALVDNNSVSYFYYKGGAMGYEYELLKRLCGHLGVDLRIQLIASIEEAIQRLQSGQGDVIAFPFTVTRERRKLVEFTDTHFNTSQVLVQRKPENWMDNPTLAERKMIRNPSELIGKTVYVKSNSAFKDRLVNLSQEIGGEIIIVEDSASAETESLIRKVAEGKIDLTVSDQTIAMVNAAYYSNLDVSTMVSLPQQIAWAVRKSSPDLLTEINRWLAVVKKEGTFNVIYNRYFNSPRTMVSRRKSDFSSLGGNKISIYDEIIKREAAVINWDWRLLASMIYQESNFDPGASSWAGARGLMQLMPATGRHYGAEDLLDPVQNIRAGINFLKFLDRQWGKTIEDQHERIKFMLASYNVGLSHVIDARNLTRKYGGDPLLWDGQVEAYLLRKQDPKYFKDPVVKSGYCRCEEPVNYVKEVLHRFEEYKLHIK